jgi:hypothetical protein
MRATSSVEGFLPFLGSGGGLRVEATDGGLLIGGEGPFRPAGRDLFWDPSATNSPVNPFGTTVYGFTRGRDGKVAYMTPQPGLSPLEKVPGWADPELRATALRWLGYGLFVGLVGLGWKRRRRADWLAIAAAVAPPLLVLALPETISFGMDERGLEPYLLEGHSARFAAIVAIAAMVAACAATTVLVAIRWRHEADRPRWNRLSIAVVALVQAAAVVTLWSVNAFGWI